MTVSEETYPRDLVGYGANPPDPKWPGGARLAVNFVVNYEEGSESSIAEGDGFTEANLTESPSSPVPRGERDLGAESMFEYGSRVGFWRLMRLFAERQLPLTVFGCAMALERNPEAAAAIVEAGHDVCCHGWRWVEHYRLDEAEEAEHIPMVRSGMCFRACSCSGRVACSSDRKCSTTVRICSLSGNAVSRLSPVGS